MIAVPKIFETILKDFFLERQCQKSEKLERRALKAPCIHVSSGSMDPCSMRGATTTNSICEKDKRLKTKASRLALRAYLSTRRQ
jgi:hypothetical protein